MKVLAGAGLGLRRECIDSLQARPGDLPAFVELAPENWMERGGRSREQLEWFAERLPIVCHGLSLSLGGLAPLDSEFVRRVGRFMHGRNMPLYSEHLSYCTDDGHLYDLLPIPFTEEAVMHVAARIRQTQDILGTRIAVENTSYYLHAPICTMTEAEFINAVVSEADCLLHLDVNNVFVNSVNHGFNPEAFIDAMPAGRVAYLHVAGHEQEAPDLLIDTHGDPVRDVVWELLGRAYTRFGPLPTLLERDFNLPPLDDLLTEVARIERLQRAHAGDAAMPVGDREALPRLPGHEPRHQACATASMREPT